jgi:hypothetical protein
VPGSRPEAGSSECAGKRGVSGAEEPRSAWKMHTNSTPPMGPSGERFCPRSHGRSWRGPGTPFLGIWSDSEGTGLDLRSGPPLGPSCENSARAAYGGWISRMSAFGGRNGRFSSCFPVELGRPSGPQGAPQLKTSMNPNLHESHPNLHHGAVGGKFRPSASWGVRIAPEQPPRASQSFRTASQDVPDPEDSLPGRPRASQSPRTASQGVPEPQNSLPGRPRP